METSIRQTQIFDSQQRREYRVARQQIIRGSHVFGAGILATAMSVYHFATEEGLLGLIRTPANTVAESAAPSGIPTSYRSDSVLPESKYEPSAGFDVRMNGLTNSFSSQGDMRVFFSPQGGCTEAIVAEVNQAQRELLIQAYSFTSQPIASACVSAHQRGVNVIAILDKSQETEQYSAADFLLNSGIPTVIDSKHQIAHNKVILIDGRTVITGSFNFTTNAEKSNAENLLIIHDRPDLYSAYEANMRIHFDHSDPYGGHHQSSKPPKFGTTRH